MDDPEATQYTVGDADIRRELIFSIVLLFLYPVPIMWACFTLMPSFGSQVMVLFLAFTFLVELFSAVERTLLLKGMERTAVRLDDRAVTKIVGSSEERTPYEEVTRVAVRRSLWRSRLVSVVLHRRDGRPRYLPGFEALEKAVEVLAGRVGRDKVVRDRAGRAAFLFLFLLFLGVSAAGLLAGMVPARLTALVVAFSVSAILLRFPFHRVLGIRFRPLDMMLVGAYGAVGLVLCGLAGYQTLDQHLSLRDALRGVNAAKVDVRSRALESLAQVGGARAVGEVSELAGSADPAVRAEAVLALGRFRDAGARKPLVTALDDTDPTVRRYAAFGLGCAGSMKNVPPLIRVLRRRGEDPDVLAAANVSLERITGTAFMESLHWGRMDEQERKLLVEFWSKVWMDYLRAK
jgi:hypothetical protein